MKRTARAAAAVIVAAASIGAAAPHADASPRNPLTPAASDHPGACKDTRTVTIKGRNRVIANWGGGQPIHTFTAIKAYKAAGFKGDDLTTMLAVARGESGVRKSTGDPHRVLCPFARHYNRSKSSGRILSTDYGLSQINTGRRANPWADAYKLDNVNSNARAAYRVYKGARYTFKRWNAYPVDPWEMAWARSEIAAAKKTGVL